MNFVKILLLINVLILLLLVCLHKNSFADQNKADIKVFKYKHFFKEWDIPYKKTKNGWNVDISLDKNGLLDDKSWVEVTNDPNQSIKSFYLLDSQDEKTIRTEPLLFQTENLYHHKIIVKTFSEPVELSGPFLKDFNTNFYFSAYDIKNKFLKKIQIFIDEEKYSEIFVNLDPKKKPHYFNSNFLEL